MNNMNPEFKIREVAERIRLTRESVGFTPEEMAEKCGKFFAQSPLFDVLWHRVDDHQRLVLCGLRSGNLV